MTLKELQTALKSTNNTKRIDALLKFRAGSFGLEALPLLRQLMAEDEVTLVLRAVECVGKLGPEALTCPAGQTYSGLGKVPAELEYQLYVLGGRIWGYSLYANCYSACLDVLVKLEADPDGLLEYIHNHIGLCNPDDFLASLKVLKAMDSEDAAELAERAVEFWKPELGKTKLKQVEKILFAK